MLHLRVRQPLPPTMPLCPFNSGCGATGPCLDGACERGCTSNGAGHRRRLHRRDTASPTRSGGHCVLTPTAAWRRRQPLSARRPASTLTRPPRSLRDGLRPPTIGPARPAHRTSIATRPDVRNAPAARPRHQQRLLPVRRRVICAGGFCVTRRGRARVPRHRRVLRHPILHRRPLPVAGTPGGFRAGMAGLISRPCSRPR